LSCRQARNGKGISRLLFQVLTDNADRNED
jgi:hypothetical protein